MTTAALPLNALNPVNAWNLEYYHTMAAAERARLNVAKTQRYAVPRTLRFVAEVFLVYPFYAVTRDTEKLVSLLEEFETFPASVLLQEDTEKMPEELHDLFKKMCAVIQKTEVVGLRNGRILRNSITKMAALSQQISGFAVRFEDAQNKLRSRVPAEQVPQYQESFAAYSVCAPTVDQATEEDVKRELLRF